MILITGGISSIGLGIVQKLISDDKKIRILSNGSLSEQISDIQKIEIWNGDTLNKKSIASICNNVSKVVHIISENNRNELQQTDKLMIDGTINLLSEVKRSKVNQFILVSSHFAIGKNENRYSLPYKIVERIVRESTIPYTIVRPSLLYSSCHFSEFYEFVEVLKKYQIILTTRNQSCKIRPLFLGDLIEVISFLLKRNGEKKNYNLSGKDYISIRKFIQLCMLYSGYRKKVVIYLPIFLKKVITFMYENKSLIKLLTIKNQYDDLDTVDTFSAFGLNQSSIENNLEKCLLILRDNKNNNYLRVG